ncbi:helix-turn-helix domain-containing protein [Halapricum desulfuricans]|uniref:Transcriptional regulator containing HTH domain,ArsR family n=1 Tax=Halapricum desulfuricans TaxID=2841257 RepID=A0A897NF78_9EURY|nr:ArsR family transcriptional regulator [Halapricum desulfuricans]QSG09837.1 Transcriptional regulator containing HTH domain,ArsR family [Halapricum desulfuricans]QSG11074.1 Transcriptional regulator containing HTH domain,ArsR family [Halapricum desulfuricans]
MSTTTEGVQPELSFADSAVRDRLKELPPSAKLVAKVLEGSRPLSQGELAEQSLLPDRTVRYALNRLDEADLVGSRYSFRDARKQVYFLSDQR